jgi:hypothetical protein
MGEREHQLAVAHSETLRNQETGVATSDSERHAAQRRHLERVVAAAKANGVINQSAQAELNRPYVASYKPPANWPAKSE